LLDTGPLVAMLSSEDSAHEASTASFESIEGHVLTTEAVLTEAMHLLGRVPGGAHACLEVFLRPGVILVAATTARLRRCDELMARYPDTPMDFADATLVALAEDLGIGRVLTLDRRGFTTYRWRTNKRFTILP
jgi:predicted nucleic acid-binding protein